MNSTTEKSVTVSGLRAIREYNAAAKPNSELLATLREAVPQFFDADGQFKREKFDAELATANVSEAHDGYQLKFVGKDYARLQSGQKSEMLLSPDVAHNALPENAASGNVFITGDNLEALRHLVNAYERRVKVIYIDPPYNTGGDDFIYKDERIWSDEDLAQKLDYGDNEIARLRTLEGKSSHSAWLTFMYPRLKLAQKLLADDGVIFVSIDDNEQTNLKMLMDEVFGEINFVATIPRVAKRTSDKGTHFRPTKDYMLVFAKSIISLAEFGIEKKIDETDYNLTEPDGRRYKKSGASLYQPSLDSRPNQRYYIEAPDGSLIIPPGTVFPDEKKDASKITPLSNADKVWRWSVSSYLKQKHLLIFTKGTAQNPLLDENANQSKWNIYPKVYMDEDIDASLHPEDIIYDYPNSQATKELNALDIPFDFAKPSGLILYLIKLLNDKQMMVLDFFAGSGTTAHAVMQLNADDGGNRKFIMVQLDERTNENSEARKAGYNTIDEISRERIKRAAKKIKEDAGLTLPQNFDGGFKHFRLCSPSAATLDKIDVFTPDEKFADDMVTPFADRASGATGADVLLTTWLVNDGFTFDTPVEKFNFSGYTAHLAAGKLYIIEQGWETAQTKELLNKIGTNELNVQHIVLYAYSFSMESLRELEINVKNTLDGDHQVFVERRY